jgi:hypothetical protein
MRSLELTASLFREISQQLPELKKNTSMIMNECHNSNYSEDFWWVLVGRYSIYACFLKLQYGDNSIYVENLFLQKFEEKYTVMELNRRAIALNTPFCIGLVDDIEVDCSFDKNKLIIDEDFFDTSISSDDNIFIPYKRLFYFLQKALNLYRRIKKPIDNFCSDQKPEKLDFKYMFLSLVPIIYKTSDYLFFYKLINTLPKKKTVTFLGYELSQIELMYISCLYQSRSEDNNDKIHVLTHGVSAKINPEFIWYKDVYKSRLKLLTKSRLKLVTKSLLLPEINKKKSVQKLKKPKLLIIAPDRMDGVFSPNEKLCKCYLNIYNNTLLYLADKYQDLLDISIRRKTFYSASPIIRFSEVPFKAELETFEKTYVNYDLFVIFDINTILSKCHVNKLNYISYYGLYAPTTLEIYNWAEALTDVYFDELIFMKNLELKINKLFS